jgi:hypothetical protein
MAARGGAPVHRVQSRRQKVPAVCVGLARVERAEKPTPGRSLDMSYE